MRTPTFLQRSPMAALLLGLVVTVVTVIGYSWYISGQITRLRQLQTDLTDRNRRDSLQLLRIQNDLNQLALAMRDMLDPEQPYPLIAWSAQFERIRSDLADAMAQQAAVGASRRTPDQNQFLASAVTQLWDAVDRMFARAKAGDDEAARAQVRVTLQARQAALNTAVSRLLVQNNEAERQTAERVQGIYRDVQQQVYWFLAATLAAIVATSLYMMHANRALFARLAVLSDERRELARTLIQTRESTLRDIARELHDELGQLLTAIGSMLGRASRQPEVTPSTKQELREIGEVAQTALDNVRGLSQSLHPSTLEELGLESAITWYLSTVERQLGLRVSFDRDGTARRVSDTVAIHVYRVLQESLSNVARHSGTTAAAVRLHFDGDSLTLDVEDAGRGLSPDTASRGLGLVAMRERAGLLGGTLELLRPANGGTLVRLVVPIGVAHA